MAVSKVILNGGVLIDVTQTTVEAGEMVSPRTALNNAGNMITGTIIDGMPIGYGNNTTDIAGAGEADYMVLGSTEYMSVIGYGAVGYCDVR